MHYSTCKADLAYRRVVTMVACMGPIDIALPLISCLIGCCLPVKRLLIVAGRCI